MRLTRRPSGRLRPLADTLEPRRLLAVTPGAPDPSFGTGGIVRVDSLNAVEAIALQPDGRLLVATHQGLLRYNIDGSPDTGFRAGDPSAVPFFGVSDLYVAPSGDIVVGISTAAAGATGGSVVRFHPDGTLDAGFGVVPFDLVPRAPTGEPGESLAAVATQPDGSVLVAGWASLEPNPSDGIVVVRYRPDGSRDLAFGGPGATNGVARIDFPGGHDFVVDLVAHPDGRFTVGGYQSTAAGATTSAFLFGQFRADGSPDPTFGSSGNGQVRIEWPFAEARNLVRLSDGRLVMFGRAGNLLSGLEHFGAVSVNPDGSPYGLYSPRGVLITPFRSGSSSGTPGTAGGGAGADGRVIFGGTVGLPGFNSDIAFARFNAAGGQDGTFASPGRTYVLTDLGGVSEQARGVVVRPDGRPIVWATGASGAAGSVLVQYVAAPGAPIPNPGGPYAVPEGGVVTLDANRTFAPAGSITAYEWDFDYGGTPASFGVDATGVVVNFSAAGLDGPLTRTVALRVRDVEGRSAIATTTVRVTNAPPTLIATGSGSRAVAGQVYTLQLSRSGAGADALTGWTIDWGDGTVDTLPGTAASAAHTYAGPARTVEPRVTATDQNGGPYVATLRAGRNAGLFDPTFADGRGYDQNVFYAGRGAVIPDGTGRFYTIGQRGGTAFPPALSRMLVARHNADGSPDASFGLDGTGVVETDWVQMGSRTDAVHAYADGSVLVAGAAGVVTNPRNTFIALVRYRPDGSLDTSFSDDGRLLILSDLDVTPDDMVVQPDGKIVILRRTEFAFQLTRLLPDGSADTTFGSEGVALLRPPSRDLGPGNPMWRASLALARDGKLMLAGGVWDIQRTGWDGIVARFNPDGTPDTMFGAASPGDGLAAGSGYSLVRLADRVGDEWLSDLAVQEDGRIVAVGNRIIPPYSAYFFDRFAVRLRADGTPDPTFDGDGMRVVPYTGEPTWNGLRSAQAATVAIDRYGRIVIGGVDTTGLALARLNPDGSSDLAFGARGDGTVSEPPPSENNVFAIRDLLFQPDGTGIIGIVDTPSRGGSPAETVGIARYTDRPPGLKIVEVPEAVPPTVTASSFSDGAGGHVITLDFSEDVLDSLRRADLVLTNIDLNEPNVVPGFDSPIFGWSFVASGGNGQPAHASWGYGTGPTGNRLRPGRYRATLPAGSVADAAGNELVQDFSFEFRVLPAVQHVWLGSSAWTETFRNHIGFNALGYFRTGYEVFPNELSVPLPWANLDQVSVGFDAPVNLTADDVRVLGAAVTRYGIRAFRYDPDERIATWTLDRRVGAEKLLAGVNPAVAASAGLYRVDVLPGNVSRDARVDNLDLALLMARRGARAGQPRYSVFYDLDGDGVIGTLDVVTALRSRYARLPTGDPVPPPAAPAAPAPPPESTADALFATSPILG